MSECGLKCIYWNDGICSDTEEFYNNGELCCRNHPNAVARDYIQERLDRVEAVWQKYKHMDKTFNDERWTVIRDLWQAIRRIS